ncbi:MAG: 4Fe-4S dicluster domain-containing protein [Planctomycetales bacterium]
MNLSPNQARHDYVKQGTTVGFFTDPTLCIGCKACEVACKEWNELPADGMEWTGNSYDNTGELGASTWRHVKFLELDEPLTSDPTGPLTPAGDSVGWLFVSDVCKHCENAGCLEACPTGAIVRTEIGSVFVQNDVCNGCGYCVVTCPFGVVDRRPEPQADSGGAFKCTFCHDRQTDGLTPACAKACPTESILFGPLDSLREAADHRVEQLRERGFQDARVYDPIDTSVGGTHAIFLLPRASERLGFPDRPEVPTIYLRASWTAALLTSAAMFLASWLAFALT